MEHSSYTEKPLKQIALAISVTVALVGEELEKADGTGRGQKTHSREVWRSGSAPIRVLALVGRDPRVIFLPSSVYQAIHPLWATYKSQFS